MSTIDKLKALVKGINSNKGTENCAHCALRLDQHFAVGKNLELGPVPQEGGLLITYPRFKQNKMVGSKSHDKRLLERQATPSLRYLYSLEDENNPTYTIDLTDNLTAPEARFFPATFDNLNQTLRSLVRRKNDNTAYGFILLTNQSKNRGGHLLNFYVDETDQVYFIDAQRQNENEQITQNLDMKGYRAEIFFLQSVPPEGFNIKFEKNESETPVPIKKEISENSANPLLTDEERFEQALKATEVDDKSAIAWHNLGFCYQKAIGTTYNPEQAFKYYKKATELDSKYAPAWDNLGLCHKTAGNPDEAFRCSKKAIEVDDKFAPAWNSLGLCHKNAIGTTSDPEEAFKCFKKATELDDKFAPAWCNLGVYYQNDIHIAGSPEEAFKCYKKATELDSKCAAAWNNLGLCHKNAIGTAHNPDEAFKCFKKATEIDDKFVAAWYHLGACYQNAIGTARNFDEAFKCFKKATELDSKCAAAWRNLGLCHKNAIGTTHNPDEAFKCYKKATEVDDKFAPAWTNLGYCYRDGIGTARNPVEAEKCFQKARGEKVLTAVTLPVSAPAPVLFSAQQKNGLPDTRPTLPPIASVSPPPSQPAAPLNLSTTLLAQREQEIKLLKEANENLQKRLAIKDAEIEALKKQMAAPPLYIETPHYSNR